MIKVPYCYNKLKNLPLLSMRKNIAILFMMTAIVTMMVHMVIPHHEHGETVCFERLSCDSEQDAAKETHACCLDQQEIIRAQDDEYQFDCVHGTDCEVHFPHIELFIGNFFDLGVNPIKIDKPYLNLYTSADIISVNALRGPPQI